MPVPDFSPGEVLTAAAMDSIGLWLVKTQTIGAGVSSVVVADAFNSDFENYKITVSDMSFASGNVRIRMTLSGTTAQGFRHGGWRSSYSAGTLDSEQGINLFSWPVSLAGTGKMGFTMEVLSPQLATRTEYTSASAAVDFSYFQAGIETSSSVHTGFTLTADSSQQMTGGTIRVYGYRN
jgi:hypothetical protein